MPDRTRPTRPVRRLTGLVRVGLAMIAALALFQGALAQPASAAQGNNGNGKGGRDDNRGPSPAPAPVTPPPTVATTPTTVPKPVVPAPVVAPTTVAPPTVVTTTTPPAVAPAVPPAPTGTASVSSAVPAGTSSPAAASVAPPAVPSTVPREVASSVQDVAAAVGNLNFAPPPAPTTAAASTPVVSGLAPVAAVPFEPFPLAATSRSNGPSPFVLLLLAVGAISLGIFLGPRVRRVSSYWIAEARLAFLSRKPPTS